MAKILPFKAIRPVPHKVHLVASRSVDGYNTTDLNSKLKENPYTFLHVINPDFEDGIKTKPGSAERLKKTKNKFIKLYQEGNFITEPSPCYYLYRQIKENNTYIGILAICSIDDYFNGSIKIHEQTITEREEKLKQYLEVCDFNAEPVLFSFPDHTDITTVIQQTLNKVPVNDFTTTDTLRHTLWIIEDKETIHTIERSFAEISSIYIADGHHRSASSALLGKSKRENAGNYTGNEPFNFYLGAFFPESQLKIYDYNRLVKDLNGLSSIEFIEKLKEKFLVEEQHSLLHKPAHKHAFSMYLNSKWYNLNLKKEFINDSDPAGSLDPALLTKYILDPLLNIHDLKTDKRISFINGTKGMEALKLQVDSGKFAVAFGLYPVTMKQLKQIADAHQIMPPKSTWVEPKMRSGLVIYSLSDF